MKKTVAGVICLLAIKNVANAQLRYTDDWVPKPVIHQVDTAFAKAEAVVIEQSIALQVEDGSDKQTYTYRTLHKIIKVLDERGIESYNKMSFPVSKSIDVINLKARTILPDGKVLEITKDKMKTVTNEDGSSEQVFALEGVEKGAEIELLYSYKRPVGLFGSETIQYAFPIMHSSFLLESPKRVIFQGKSYNGFTAPHDSLSDNKRYVMAEMNNIPELKSEEYSFYDLNRMRIDYKVSYLPEEKTDVRMFTWQDMVKRLYENTYTVTDKETKAVQQYLKTLGVQESDSEPEKIKKIETGIKSNITYYRELEDQNSWRLDNIINKKSATETGLNRLFAACFKQAGVNHELGITTNKTQAAFDSDFENWNLMEDYVFFFPNQKKFLYPTGTYYRYPYVPSSMLNNKGIFCKLMTLGEMTSAVADVRTITSMPYAETCHNLDATVTFTDDMECKTSITCSFGGYAALGLREAALLLPKDKIKELVTSLVSICDKPENMISYSTANEGFENYYTATPLKAVAEIKTPQLVEKAGNKYVFKLGEIIGRQSELYQEDKRKLPIDLPYPHSLVRDIVVVIPEGYKVLNPETINMSQELKEADGRVSAAFISSYKLVGNKLMITINEYYAQTHYEISQYETYRKVINAAADFNKVNLLLAK